MELVLISKSKGIHPETNLVTKMFDLGLSKFHLRKPGFSSSKMKEYLSHIPKHYWNKIIIHSKHLLAAKYPVGGVHFTKKDRNNQLRLWLLKQYLRKARPGLIYTTSFHSLESLTDEKRKYSYVFLSPVFNSISKSNYQGKFNNSNFNVYLKKLKQNVYALGGIDTDKVSPVFSMGFAGMAVHGSIWKSEDPVMKFEEIYNLCQEQPMCLQ